MAPIQIILAEDHAVVREGIRDLLEGQDDIRVVAEADDGKAAISLTSRMKPDLVLMDIAMPGINGIEATREIKRNNSIVKILILSSYDNEEFIFEAIKAKAAGYLLKDLDGKELLDAIRRVHRGDSVLHPGITSKVIARLAEELEIEDSMDVPDIPNPQEPETPLTARELGVIRLGSKGYSNKSIAEITGLSERTVQTHWRNIFGKLNSSSRLEAVMFCLKNRWISLDDDE